MNATLVKPATCSRCKGKGVLLSQMHVEHNGLPGGCYTCHGEGVVEGDKATIDARRREARELEALRRQALAALKGDDRARWGLERLENLEPARFPAAMRAVVAGHPKVRAALVAYLETHPLPQG